MKHHHSEMPQRLFDLAARGAAGLQIPIPPLSEAIPSAWLERLDAIGFGEPPAQPGIDPDVVEELRSLFISAPSERLRGLALGLLFAYLNLA